MARLAQGFARAMPLQVLVMESDAMLSRALARVFQTARPKFFIARTIEEATERLAGSKIEVVVVDEAMGTDACSAVLEKARALQPAAHRFLIIDAPPGSEHETRDVPATVIARSWFDGLQNPLGTLPVL